MDARAFDNIQMTSLPDLLDERRTLARYFPLIPYRERMASASASLGIQDKYGYLEAARELREAFVCAAGLDPAMEPLLVRFLHLYDLKPRRLADACEIEGLPASLGRSPLRSAQAYMQCCMQDGLGAAAGRLQISADYARLLFCLCDLMRLPGVSIGCISEPALRAAVPRLNTSAVLEIGSTISASRRRAQPSQLRRLGAGRVSAARLESFAAARCRSHSGAITRRRAAARDVSRTAQTGFGYASYA